MSKKRLLFDMTPLLFGGKILPLGQECFLLGLKLVRVVLFSVCIFGSVVVFQAKAEEIIELKTGKTVQGDLVEESDDYITIKTVQGVLKIPAKQVASRKTQGDKPSGKNFVSTGDSRLNQPSNMLLMGRIEEEKFKNRVGSLLVEKKFAELEEMVAEYRKNKTRDSIGNWKLELFYAGLMSSFVPHAHQRISPSIRMKYIDLVQEWGNMVPSSVAQKIALAIGYRSLAWDYRGNGYANTVDEQKAQKFEENLEKAAEILAEAVKLPEKDPELYATWITVSMGLSQPKIYLLGILEQGLKVEPYYPRLYSAITRALLPRWGGSPGDNERYAETAAERTKADAGEQYYALIADFVRDAVGNTDFAEHNFSYPRVKKGFQEFLSQYPNNFYIINSFTWFACNAQDQKTAHELFERIGDNWDEDSKDVWETKEAFNKWRAWAMKKGEMVVEDKEIIQAVLSSEYAKVSDLLIKGANVNALDVNGNTLLYLAITKPDFPMVQLLLSSGADASLAGTGGESPIHIATASNLLEVVRILIDKGVSVNSATAKGGWTPLHTSAYYGYPDLTKYLLSVPGIDVNKRRTDGGWMPIHMAAQEGRKAVMRLFIEHKMMLDAKSDNGTTPMHLAASQGHVNIVKMLEEAGANINLTDNSGATPLDWAKRSDNKDVIQYLESKKAETGKMSCTLDNLKETSRLNDEGNEYLKQQKFEEARKLFEQSLEKCPTIAIPYFNLYLIYYNLDRNYPKALEAIKKALEFNPRETRYYYEAGKTLFTMGDKKAGTTYFCQFLQMAPDSPPAISLIKEFPFLADCNEKSKLENVFGK